jgi:uncharacterized protein
MSSRTVRSGAVRAVWFGAGCVCVALGVVGAILPLMPTTVFLIIAAGCFARSSPKLEGWILSHTRFGPAVRAWRERGAISSAAKNAAYLGIAGGYGIFVVTARPSLWLALIVAALLACVGAFIASRPT